MKKVKKILQCAAFLFLCILLTERITWVLKSNLEESRENLAAFSNEEPLDLILCDGSCVLRFYEPMIAWEQKGIASYNCASSACTADMIEYCLRQSRTSGQHPQLYICELRTLSLLGTEMKDTDESSIRNWSDSVPTFSLSRLAGISRFLKNRGWVSSEELPAYYFDIFKYHTQTEQLARESQWKYLRPSSFHSISRGYGITAPVHTPFERPAVVDEIGTLSELQEQVLESLLDYCDREKLPILFTCCPFIIKENDWKVLNAAEALITARGYDFVNFNRYYSEIGLDFDTDFKDVNHVNHLGAEKYTAFLVDYLSAHYDLPDHRGEARYAAWNEDLEAYAEMEQNWRDRTEALVRKHAAARDTGATLPETDVFKTWNSMIQDDSFTVIILQKQSLGNPGKDSSWTAFLGKYGIDPDLLAQMVVQSGRKAISPQEEAAEDGILSFWIGVDSGRGRDLCRLSAERGILTVAGVDYWQDGAAMQVVVYDNNYKTVVDAVMLSLDENGKAVISR